MTQTSILQHIADAKKAHLRWVKRADHLISGLPVDKEFIPLEATSCGFGLWVYSEGAKLRLVPSIDNLMNRIEHHHNDLHDAYMDIYKIFFIMPQQRSILHKILTFNSKIVSSSEKEKARAHFKYLKRSSEELLAVLDILEEKVKQMTSDEVENLK
ncbi:MAG TPA: hypothetical protein ENK98_04500 [Epsilonproteobacteria bacterium]|nr:hypothetical protein [Campylobacterota bacterium]HHD78881.1 hypothetical protein [Campylobacterota bacterium]